MRLFALTTNRVKKGDDLADLALKSMERAGLVLDDGDVLAFASKIVSLSEGRIAKLSDFEASDEAKKLAKRYSIMPEFAELIVQEAEMIYGGVRKAVLAMKNLILSPNAGIDNKNAPAGQVVLWPSNPKRAVKDIREAIMRRKKRKIGVLLVDSALIPLRIGTVGFALSVAGFEPIKDMRGEKDLFGKPLTITRHAIADDLAAAAHLLMSEAAEKTPIVLIKKAPIILTDQTYDGKDMAIPIEECIFMNSFVESAPVSKRK